MADALKLAIGNPLEGFLWGMASDAGLPALGSLEMGTQNVGFGMVDIVQEDCTITAVGCHIAVISGTGIGATSLTATVQTIDTSGLPNGDAGTTATNFGTGSFAGASTWAWITLGTPIAVTKGQRIAITIHRNTNTATDITTNHATFNPDLTGPLESMPYGVRRSAASAWSKTGSVSPTLGYQSNTNSYGRPYTGSAFFTSRTFGGTTEAGFDFIVPTAYCSTFQVAGVRIGLTDPTGSTTNTWQMNLYSGALATTPTNLATESFVTNHFGNSAGARRNAQVFFSSQPVLTAGTKYGIGFGTTTGADCGLYSIDVGTAADLTAYDMEQQFAYIQRTITSYATPISDTAAFTETATRRIMASLRINVITPPSGGSGMLFIPDLAGT